ncbi:hypothetical protein [Nocardia sp. NPDC006630]|uniref:hypothetical protein n=1 Tax=Nocardia sp. NPDC006630 TaxID=3157181 RepID=UPI0033BCCFC1
MAPTPLEIARAVSVQRDPGMAGGPGDSLVVAADNRIEARTLRDVAQDMEAAAIEAGDRSEAGPGRVFAAQRAAAAHELAVAAELDKGPPSTGHFSDAVGETFLPRQAGVFRCSCGCRGWRTSW